MKTHISVKGEQFYINGQPVYSEISPGNPEAHGLLMNARFIQGIFDDKADPQRFARFGWDKWDPERNTKGLIKALPEWYSYGLRAITVGLQGGMPVFTIKNETINNNPFSEDGKEIDPAYLSRLDSLIRAADDIGMVIIVSILYEGQSPRLRDGRTIRNAVTSACRFLRDNKYTNVIIEVANECNVGQFKRHPLVYFGEGAAALVDLAREESGGMLVGCSLGGGDVDRDIAEASDVILIHGNGTTRQHYFNQVRKVREFNLNRPIVCNEDSPCIGQLQVAFDTKTSWGYYNNLTKQEPPADWSVTKGEDLFFARRVARGVGMQLEELPLEEQYYFQGFEKNIAAGNRRWLRVASEFPETIDKVCFYRNGELMDIAYDEPFFLYYQTTWMQDSVEVLPGDEWRAEVHLTTGETLDLVEKVE